MPRLKPPPEYMTSREVCDLLGISDSTLSVYVKSGWLRRYGPVQRKHKFYKRSEVEAFNAARNTFDTFQDVLPSSFGGAMEEDIHTIVDIDNRIFDAGIRDETYARWLRRNPETFFVLRAGDPAHIVGYACLLPLSQEVMDRFIRGEITMEDISPDNVRDYVPGVPLHLYVIALGVDPTYRVAVKHEYGSRIVRGIYTFFLDLALRGVEIETITARTRTPDGIRLMRKLGMPQLRSPVPGKHLFRVRVAESGFPLLVRYSDLLEQWKREHSPLAS